MRKSLFTLFIALFSLGAFAQTPPAQATSLQFMLIVRFKANFVPPSADAIQKNIKAWQAYMGDLGKNGKIAGGYRPGNGGETISGSTQTTKPGAYVANDELLSSIIIINAKDMDEARAIAKKCPVFEFNGSVEIRPIQNIYNYTFSVIK